MNAQGQPGVDTGGITPWSGRRGVPIVLEPTFAAADIFFVRKLGAAVTPA